MESVRTVTFVGVRATLSDVDLMDYFGQFGQVAKVNRFRANSGDTRITGRGSVTFTSQAAAVAVYKQNVHTVGSSALTICMHNP